MPQIKFIFLLNACIIIMTTTVFAQPVMKVDQKIATHLRTFRASYINSMMKKNNATIQNYYSENVRLMPEFQKTVTGKNNALLYYKAFSARFDIENYTRSEIEILDLGSQVAEI